MVARRLDMACCTQRVVAPSSLPQVVGSRRVHQAGIIARHRKRGSKTLSNVQHSEERSIPTRCSECPIRAKALFQVVADDYLQDAESRRTAQYQLPARAHLYQENQPATMAYTLFDGWLMLYRADAKGGRQGLRVALPGDFVGYTPLPDASYSHSALAVTAAVVCAFRQSDLHAMIDRHDDIGRHINHIQARDLQTCETSILGLGRRSAEQRIAHLVLDLHHRLAHRGEVDDDAQSFHCPLTQEMLGELTGLTPVHTNRVLRKLRTDGLMICERQRVQILDMPGLIELAEFRPTGVV
jgi:CRP-like cAMP-binding protein